MTTIGTLQQSSVYNYVVKE